MRDYIAFPGWRRFKNGLHALQYIEAELGPEREDSMNPGSGDGWNWQGPLFVGGVTVMAGAHGLVVTHYHKQQNPQPEIREEIAPQLLQAVHPEPKDEHAHPGEYSTEPARGHFVGINTSGDACFIVRQDFLDGKSTLEVYGRKFFIPTAR